MGMAAIFAMLPRPQRHLYIYTERSGVGKILAKGSYIITSSMVSLSQHHSCVFLVNPQKYWLLLLTDRGGVGWEGGLS